MTDKTFVGSTFTISVDLKHDDQSRAYTTKGTLLCQADDLECTNPEEWAA